MIDTPFKQELERLRRDFEIQASHYHDLTLTVCYETSEGPVGPIAFRWPNHKISLWQYFGNMTSETDVKDLLRFECTEFGVTKAEVSAFGLIMGPATPLFLRMATRAGSLMPGEINHIVTAEVAGKFVDQDQAGKPIFVANPNPLAVWLNLVLVFTATFQSERFRNNTLAVDPFTASLVVFDDLRRQLDSRELYHLSDVGSVSQKRFKVALSFPGERREYVGKIAAGLQEKLGDVFYDLYYEAELARPNLDTLLQKIYHDNSDLVVAFLCEQYERKEWPGLEWRAVRDLIKMRKDDSIMLMRFDEVDIPGIFSIDGYVDLRKRTTEEAVDIICQRYRSLAAKTIT